MAKKRKTRASQRQPQPEPEQTQEPEPQFQEPDPPQPDPEPTNQQVLVQQEVEQDPEAEAEEVEEEAEQQMEQMEAEVAKGDANGGAESAINGGESKVEEEDDDFEEEPLEKVLEPFSKDQLKALVQEAVAKHPDFMANVTAWADKDPSHRKIFVHGLGWDTTAETLTEEFGKYGEIEDCKAVTDKVSGKSKGYAFILFKHWAGARKALKQPQKKIGNRLTSCQLASAGPVPAPPPNAAPVSEYTQRKIFVSNVAADIDPQKLLGFFSKFGEIEEGPLGLDKMTGKPKGFCLFVYKTIEGAKKALEEPQKGFEGHMLNCQKAIDGPKQNKNFHQQQQHQHQQPHFPKHHQHQNQQQHYQRPAKKGKYSTGAAASTGHLMAPSAPQPAVGFNPAVAPALGQALTALLATQGAGLGVGNLLGGIGPVNPQGVPPVMNNTAGYGVQGGAGGYGVQPPMQGGYQNPQMGHGGVRPQGGGPYMGHGH